jgi:hypothetical protein
VRRAAFAVIAALALGLAGAPRVDGGAALTVGAVRLDADGLDRRAADRAIERLWLQGEAAERGLPLDRARAPLAQLRGAVADALAPERDARRFAQAFDAFHARWRARTRCERRHHDPYWDRCANLAGAPAGTCRWMGDPDLSAPALAAARSACADQVAASDPYLFGFGMQDVVGGAEGLIAARIALARRLAGAAGDVHDRRKLQPLVRAVRAGNRELARLAAAAAAGDDAATAAVLARLDARTEPERALARGLDLGDCLVRPAR